MSLTLAGVMCCVVLLAGPAAFADQQEYTLYFGLMLNEAAADEAEREYLAAIGRAKSVPAVEFDIVVELVTNNCETIVKHGGGIFSSHTLHYPCGVDLEAGEYDWVAMAEGTARSTDRDALLAVAAEMRPHTYKLSVGESRQLSWLLLLAGLPAAIPLGVVMFPKVSKSEYFSPSILLFVVCGLIVVAPYFVADIMNSMTYDSLLDMPAGTLPSTTEAVTRDLGVAGVPAKTDLAGTAQPPSTECSPVSGTGVPDGTVLCVP